MNAGKTQLLVSSNAGPTSGLTVRVGNDDIKCSETLELLGVGYDRKLSAAPHADKKIKAAKQRAALILWLAHQIPRGRYLKQLACGLVLGKTGHALAAVATPKLTADTPTNGKLKAVQKAFNNVCRSITGNKRSDRIKVADLSKEANLPTVNELITRAVAPRPGRHSTVMNRGGVTHSGLQCLSPPGTASTLARPRTARSRTQCRSLKISCLTASRSGMCVQNCEQPQPAKVPSKLHMPLQGAFPSDSEQ
jgi:hypothetical protein